MRRENCNGAEPEDGMAERRRYRVAPRIQIRSNESAAGFRPRLWGNPVTAEASEGQVLDDILAFSSYTNAQVESHLLPKEISLTSGSHCIWPFLSGRPCGFHTRPSDSRRQWRRLGQARTIAFLQRSGALNGMHKMGRENGRLPCAVTSITSWRKFDDLEKGLALSSSF